MTPAETLRELLERIGASQGAAALIDEEELSQWPAEAVRALQSHKLLVRASPAASVVCPGCEQQCTMPVHTVSDGRGNAASFVVCDKRNDINRVPISAERLSQWRASLAALGGLVARFFDITGTGTVSGQRCELGVLRGRKHSSHLVLEADNELSLHLAGHTVALADYLALEGKSLRLDKQAIIRLVDRPIAGAGDQESARQRRERLGKLVRAEKVKGNRAFLKTVAGAEGISVSRLKGILQRLSKESQPARRSAFR